MKLTLVIFLDMLDHNINNYIEQNDCHAKKSVVLFVYKITFSGQGVIPYRRYSPRAKQA